MFFSISFIVPIITSFIYKDGALSVFVITFSIVFMVGFLGWLISKNNTEDMTHKDGFLVITLFWIVLSSAGSIPFILSGMTFIDSFFESMSGITTTGATVIPNLSALPESLLLYRQLLQWMGGMGLIVLAIAVMPLLGIGGGQLYKTEIPGAMNDQKLTPRIKETAQALWLIYLLLTIFCSVFYFFAGMNAFDAISHSLSTVSIGGFSTHDANFAFFDNSSLRWTAIIFMVISGINFALHYLAWTKKRLLHYFYDSEVKLYLSLLVTTSLITYLTLLFSDNIYDEIFVDSVFQAVSIGTTTGFLTSNYSNWPLFVPIMLLIAAFIGACAGSTGGGIKVIRALILIRQGSSEITKLIHPNAIVTIKFGKKSLDPRVSESVWGFFAVYVATFLIILMFLLSQNNDFLTAFSAVGATLNNLGPGLGAVSENYKDITDGSKIALCISMLLGRLEIFTLLLLFTPAFWRN